jgi:cytochrome c oxidase subunit II
MRARVTAGLAYISTLLVGVVAACSPHQSTMNSAGPQARRIETLGLFFFVVAALVFVVVIASAAWALKVSRKRMAPLEDAGHERRIAKVVAGATGVTALILVISLVYSISAGRALGSLPRKSAITIEVTGHQWWWELRYMDTTASRQVTSANEIHIPVGEPVQIIGKSSDVIHSLWIPNLHGKKDLIPGHTTSLWIQADTAGIYRGQCAEFCGLQHAKMALWVIAEPKDKYLQWYESQLAIPAEPTDSLLASGKKVFLKSGCVMCHEIGGTMARSHIGPPLTHVASQMTLAAGSIPNTKGYMAGWILDPQQIKPGARMPPNSLAPNDLQALLAYLQSLK